MNQYYDKYSNQTIRWLGYILGIIICLVIVWRAVVH